jgi:hypothetical protein
VQDKTTKQKTQNANRKWQMAIRDKQLTPCAFGSKLSTLISSLTVERTLTRGKPNNPNNTNFGYFDNLFKILQGKNSNNKTKYHFF